MLKRAVFERILDQLVNPKLVFKEFFQNNNIDVGFFYTSKSTKMDIITIAISAIVGIVIGFFIAKILERNNASQVIVRAKRSAAAILKEAKSEAETIKKDKILQAKEKFLEMKSEHEKVILNREKKISEAEKRTRDKESQVSGELAKSKKLNASLEKRQEEYDDRIVILEKKQSEVEKLHRSQIEQLEVISSLSADEAKLQLMESLKDEAKTQAMAYIQHAIEEAKMTAKQEAKKIIINTDRKSVV